MACHPNFPILLIIKLLEPIESPRTKSNRNMVREILFLSSTYKCNFLGADNKQ